MYALYLLLLYVFVSMLIYVFFFFKQKTAYEMRISDWSSDVCSSDLRLEGPRGGAQQFVQHQLPRVPVQPAQPVGHHVGGQDADAELVARAQQVGDGAVQVAARAPQFVGQFPIGRASCREGVCQTVYI